MVKVEIVTELHPGSKTVPVEYVNVLGEPIDPSALSRKARGKAAGPRQPLHKGWLALGYSPEQIRRAQLEHAQSAERAVAAGAPPMPQFNAQSYMRRSAPSRITSRPYSVPAAAHEACLLAEKAGWLGCHTRELVSRG
jgi:hypothetical protein